MSILIKGMEMPTHCMDCPFMVSRDGDDCILQSAEANENFENWEQMKSGCPLVTVPPHGRLIDADAFAAEMKKRQDACAEWRDDIKNGGGYGTELYYRADSFLGAMCETKLTLDKIPTIIPAEEE